MQSGAEERPPGDGEAERPSTTHSHDDRVPRRPWSPIACPSMRPLFLRHERSHPDDLRPVGVTTPRRDSCSSTWNGESWRRTPSPRSTRREWGGSWRARCDLGAARARISRSGFAASTAATRSRWRSAIISVSTTSAVRLSGCRSPGWRQHRRRWRRPEPEGTPPAGPNPLSWRPCRTDDPPPQIPPPAFPCVSASSTWGPTRSGS